jgi:hypothetical protein
MAVQWLTLRCLLNSHGARYKNYYSRSNV